MNRRIIALPILALCLAVPVLAAGKKSPAQWKGSITVTGKRVEVTFIDHAGSISRD